MLASADSCRCAGAGRFQFSEQREPILDADAGRQQRALAQVPRWVEPGETPEAAPRPGSGSPLRRAARDSGRKGVALATTRQERRALG